MLPIGFSFAGVRCGLKNKRNDLGIILSDRPSVAAGVLTQNLVHAASVAYTRSVLANGQLRAVVVNSGNANCCTGEKGVEDTRRMAELTAEMLELDSNDVAVGSTGVIGHTLDMVKVENGIKDASRKLGPSPKPFMDAILTTDLVEKWAAHALGDTVTYSPALPVPDDVTANGVIYGVCKGSGMISPNMGTMLCYILTDIDVSAFELQPVLARVANKTFNSTTVDGDTSTNDMALVIANGASGRKATEEEFENALYGVCLSLAKQIARDGEGATKLLEVRVTGSSDPRKVARTVAESPLVKTAMFGCDPNWGRIMAAAGRAGVPFDPAGAKLFVHARGEAFLLFEKGTPTNFDAKVVSAALKSDHVIIDLQISDGDAVTIYSCDFGYGYVRINAEYHN